MIRVYCYVSCFALLFTHCVQHITVFYDFVVYTLLITLYFVSGDKIVYFSFFCSSAS
jgi:hypothetical protein